MSLSNLGKYRAAHTLLGEAINVNDGGGTPVIDAARLREGIRRSRRGVLALCLAGAAAFVLAAAAAWLLWTR